MKNLSVEFLQQEDQFVEIAISRTRCLVAPRVNLIREMLALLCAQTIPKSYIPFIVSMGPCFIVASPNS